MQRLIRLAPTAALLLGGASALAALVILLQGPRSALDVLLAVTATAYLSTGLVGKAIVRRSPGNAVGWILSASSAALPAAVLLMVAADAHYLHHRHVPAPAVLALASGVVVVFSVPLVATFGVLLFPDGRLSLGEGPPSRGAVWLLRACVVDLVLLVLWGLFSTTLIGTTAEGVDSPIGLAAGDALVVSILLMTPLSLLACRHLWLRANLAATPERRRALRLATGAALTLPAAYLACVVVGAAGGSTQDVGVAENVAALAIAAASWVGIVRYGLFDLRVVLSRTLLYGGLTAMVVAVYAGASTLLGRVLDGRAPAVCGAALGALAVLPVRDALQRRVDRLVFGLRDDPGAALALLGVRLDAAAAPDDVLPAAVRTVGEALRLRYVAVELDDQLVAVHGSASPGRVETVELPFAGAAIGRLVVQQRDPGELFGEAERSLLASLATQLGVAARAVALTHALEVSRERLVAAVDEERRRLRRDLHDGVGTTLAGLALGIDTARRGLPEGAAATAAQLEALRAEAEQAVRDVRRIAYALRPPILDQLGLGPAIREQARRLGGATVSIPAALPLLPPVIEVAAYRIAVEAMTNAVRHAPGAPVDVRLAVADGLSLEVSDGGPGHPDGFRAGVGITSMRERAAECGGEVRLLAREPHGTIVRVRLPLEAAMAT